MADEKDVDRGEAPPAPGPPAEATLTQPFACPNCGQLLAPECRVCVACREPVDFNQVAKQREPLPPSPAFTPASGEPAAPRVAPPTATQPGATQPASLQFSWPIFFIAVAAYLLIGYGAEHFLKAAELRWFVGGLLAGCAAWVYYDAHVQKVPHPLRWAIGTFLIWIVVFPWYLSRRRKPDLPCAVMEAPGRSFVRIVIWVLVFCAIVGLISAVIRKPH